MTSELISLIDRALKDYAEQRDSMHVPPEPHDVDMVLVACKEHVQALDWLLMHQNHVHIAGDAATGFEVTTHYDKMVIGTGPTPLAAVLDAMSKREGK